MTKALHVIILTKFKPYNEHCNGPKFISVPGYFLSIFIFGFKNVKINDFGEQVFWGAFLSN